MNEEKIKWYQKKELWGLSIFTAGLVKHITPQHTIGHQIADYSFSVGLPLLMVYFGVKDGLKNNSLPSGLRSIQKLKDRFNAIF